jgi:hypothetical protein
VNLRTLLQRESPLPKASDKINWLTNTNAGDATCGNKVSHSDSDRARRDKLDIPNGILPAA